MTNGFASTPRSWRRAMALPASGVVVTGPLVSEVLPPERWEHAFAASRAGEAVKEVLAP